MPILEKVKAQRQQILEITKSHGAYNIRIFGSIAKGDDVPGSDLDILIELAPDKSLLDIVAIKQDLEDLLGFKVDVVTEGSLSFYLKADILKTAKKL